MPDLLHRFGQRHQDGTYCFSDVRSGLIVGLLSIGTLFGALFAAPIAERVGRKKAIFGACWVVSAGFIVQIASIHAWYRFMIGRLVSGLAVGALSLLVALSIAEVDPKIRGAFVWTYQVDSSRSSLGSCSS